MDVAIGPLVTEISQLKMIQAYLDHWYRRFAFPSLRTRLETRAVDHTGDGLASTRRSAREPRRSYRGAQKRWRPTGPK
jgi:hypothetical protein